MRKIFSQTIENLVAKDDNIIFITGDLGYNAFENLQKLMGDKFINAGVAEQNMVSVAAGMAYKGYKVFCYSIAPFIVYRCLEQFRNDVCLHNLPVFLVGNGGGYGYGIMGSTHHALEDLACLSGMQNVKCHIPAFIDDVEIAVSTMISEKKPAYLRLGLGKPSPNPQTKLSSFNQVIKVDKSRGTIIALGPLVHNVLTALENPNIQNKFNLLTINSLPLFLTDEVKRIFIESPNFLIAEEHISIGGIAQQLSVKLLEDKIVVKNFISLSAQGYPNQLYGDQRYHQQQSGLDEKNIYNKLILLL